MNIFVLDKNPLKCVKHYCNIHVNKMLLETCQLLCNCCENAPYKRTHYNHPCSKWARETIQNFTWLEELGNVLSMEYTKRTGKIHACDKVLNWIANNTPNLPDKKLTAWPQCMPDKYRTERHSYSVRAYRRYYAAKLKDFRKRGLI